MDAHIPFSCYKSLIVEQIILQPLAPMHMVGQAASAAAWLL
jgi:hypothetical protein